MKPVKHVVVRNENAHTHVSDSNVRGGKMSTSEINVSELERDLHTQISGEVRFDDGSRALYATDASNYRQVPVGIVIPKDINDVIKTVALCHRYGAPILSRGGGMSLAGQTCNVAVVMDMSKYMNRVLEIDPQKRQARVQPGTILDDLRHAAERYHLTFGPDPATHNHCTLGGMIGNDSCQSFMLSEFLEQKVENYQPAKLQRKAVVHGHCHHKAVMGMTDEDKVLTKLGLEYHVLDAGCCGMAGAFGFETDHYNVSIKAGERVLLPAVRSASKDTLIIADGFSCREQIAQTTDRQALHLAQVIQMAMHEDQKGGAEEYPEAAYTKSPYPPQARLRTAAFIGAGILLLAAGGAWIGRLLGKRK